MSYPTIYYKTPGPYQGNGCTYGTIGVENEDQAKQLRAQGWFATYPEATEKKAASPAPEVPASDDNAPPTREELEKKAEELGIKFDGRTSDEKLAKKIEDAIGGK